MATGHVFYGVHEHIPQPSDYITVLRDPIARVVSMYNHILRRPEHRLHDVVAGSGMGLEEFARTSTDPGLDNQQTRLISGRGQGEVLPARPAVARGSRRRSSVATSSGRSETSTSFLLVGLTERFDETFILLRRMLGWRLPMYATRNVGRAASGSPPEPPSPPGDRAGSGSETSSTSSSTSTRAACSRRRSTRQGPSFQREVAAFRALNRIPNALAPRIPARLRHPLRAVLPR